MPRGSKIFTGYRALGFVSNHIPLCLRHHQKHNEIQVITCVGKSFHIYNCSKLGIISVGTSQTDEINCMAVDAYLIFAATGSVVKAFARKGREEVHTYRSVDKSPIHTLLPFGRHLICIDSESNVKVWDIDSEDIYLEIPFNNGSFEISCAVHPSTYLNKVLFGSRQGALQLWNLHTNKLLFTFEGWNSPVTVLEQVLFGSRQGALQLWNLHTNKLLFTFEGRNSPVRVLEQAPAIDVIAVGLANGHIHLHNIKYDETVMSFQQDWGPVTTISFRTDGHAVMTSGSPAGHIALWNLEEKKLLSQIREAHEGAVTGMQCLPNEPLMVTSSADNSLKVWIFDQSDGGGRLLRQRSGHSAPPTKVRYHDKHGQVILSAGQDSTLRNFSTIHERHDKSLGRASYNKKQTKKTGLKLDQHRMPAVIDFASESSRESDWDGIVACHHGEKMVTTWNLQRSTMGQHRLCHQRFEDKVYKHAYASCCALSSCGNFSVLGYSTGHVDLYNMQSGIHRGSYGQNTAHKGCVRAVCVDGLNQLTITGGADCNIHFWKFKLKTLLETVNMPAQVSKMLIHRESGMLAVSLDDFTVSVLDIETRRVVRNFHGHTNSITDMTLSSDSRWLVTAAMDATLRTWDLPSGSQIDCAGLDQAVTSISLSPTGDFLATTHIDDVGVYLWSNMTLYTHVALQPLSSDYTPHTLAMPDTQTPQASEISEDKSDSEDEDLTIEFKSPEQISAVLVTLSLLPNSRWQNLLSLDIIKERNKPKAPPKVPKAAPFFLPTLPGLNPQFIKEDTIEENKQGDFLAVKSILPLSEFAQLLTKGRSANNFDAALTHIKSLGPSAIDVELRSLSPEGGGSIELMSHFLAFINTSLQHHRDFELLQAYLGLFLKLHGDTLSTQPDLCAELEQIQNTMDRSWEHIQQYFQQSLCLVNYLRNAAL